MAVLTRAALEDSPLADLHTIASELGIDGFRRLRRPDLIDAILERQGGDGAVPAPADDGEDEAPAPKPRARRRRTAAAKDDPPAEEAAAEPEPEEPVTEPEEPVTEPEEPTGEPEARDDDDEGDDERRARRRRGGRGRGRRVRDDDAGEDEAGEGDVREPRRDAEDRVVEGVVEVLGNGSGFLRTSPPEPSDDDVYISAAQVRRCELVSGDRVTGPVRRPRRSERYPSLIRIDTINDRPAEEVAEGTPFDELPAEFPGERFALGADDPTLKAIEWLTPIGKGSRVTLTGAPHSGKSEALRRLAGALAAIEGLEVTLVLAGVRPEEMAGWPLEPAASLTFAASAEAQAQAVERAVETARRIAARGGDAVLLVDSLDGVQTPAARKALAAARNISGGGSLTVIAVSTQPLGHETTVIALDENLTRTQRFPALNLVRSGTLRPELLVGDAGAEAIAQARLAALG